MNERMDILKGNTVSEWYAMFHENV